MILAHPCASEAAHVFQTAGRAVGAGLRCGAVELLQLELALEHIPEDQALERGVVRAYLAGVLGHVLRERLAMPPRPHVAIVEGVGHTQHVCAGVLRIVVDAVTAQIAAAARLEINPKNSHGCLTHPLLAGTAQRPPRLSRPVYAVARRRRRGASSAATSSSTSSSAAAASASRPTHFRTSKTGVKMRP